MEDNNTVPPEYQKRFNEGYTIAQYMPELAEQLTAAMKNNERSNGFQEGRNQYLREQIKDKLPSRLTGHPPAPSPDKQSDKTKNRDMEPEP